jgi:hypothetical protein
MVLVIVWKSRGRIRYEGLRKELLLVPVIMILGILNILFSEDRPTTLKVMTLFLASGILVLGIASSVLNTRYRQEMFLWLCCACLVGFFIYGSLDYLEGKSVLLLSYNKIPAGSLLILLFSGPLLLFCSSSWWLRLLQISCIFVGIVMIVLIGKRGAILGLLVMPFVLGVLLPGRRFYIFPLIALVLVAAGYHFRDHLPPSLSKPLTGDSTLYRLEGYALAAHIFPKKPVFGIGLHAPLSPYLSNYDQETKTGGSYSEYVKTYKSFENIVLCAFVEMGGLFAITYIGLLTYLLANLFRSIRQRPENRLRAVLLLTLLFGFAVHSMTFDSLTHPHLNWLFHSLLGLMANFSET